MALSVVNFVTGGAQTGAPTFVSAAFSSTSGNLIVVGIRVGVSTPNDVTNITDTALNAYTKIPGSNQVVGAQQTEMWYAKNITGNAANIVTGHSSSSAPFTGLAVWEISGADISSPLDTFAAGTSTSPITSSAFTTALANEIICAIGSVPALGLTWSAGAGYTIDSTGFPTGNYCGAEHKIVSTIQTGVTATIVESSGVAGGISVGTFKAAPSAGGGTIAPWFLDQNSEIEFVKRRKGF